MINRPTWTVLDGGGLAPGDLNLQIDATTGAILGKTTQRYRTPRVLRKPRDSWLAMSQVAVDTASLRLTDVRSRLKAIFIGSIGNLVEWYDFYAYTAFALYFADSFFPGNGPVL